MYIKVDIKAKSLNQLTKEGRDLLQGRGCYTDKAFAEVKPRTPKVEHFTGIVIKGEQYELAGYSEPYSDGSRHATLRKVEGE